MDKSNEEISNLRQHLEEANAYLETLEVVNHLLRRQLADSNAQVEALNADNQSLLQRLKAMMLIAADQCNGMHVALEQRDNAVKRADMAVEQWNRLQVMWSEQQDKLADCQKDAARYRWIRGPDSESSRYSLWNVDYFDGPNGWEPMQQERMDAAIDAAMAKDQRS